MFSFFRGRRSICFSDMLLFSHYIWKEVNVPYLSIKWQSKDFKMKRTHIYDTFIYKVHTHIYISAICSAPCVCVCASESISLSVVDCSSPGSSVHGIVQARTVERVAIPFSRGSSQPRIQVSCIAGRFFIIWTTREARIYICVYIYIYTHRKKHQETETKRLYYHVF